MNKANRSSNEDHSHHMLDHMGKLINLEILCFVKNTLIVENLIRCISSTSLAKKGS